MNTEQGRRQSSGCRCQGHKHNALADRHPAPNGYCLQCPCTAEPGRGQTHDWIPAEHGLWQCGTCLMTLRQSTDVAEPVSDSDCPGSPYAVSADASGRTGGAA